MSIKLEALFKNIITTILLWVGVPSLIGTLANYYLNYDLVYVMIVSAIIQWAVYTECRIRDLKKKIGGKE